MTGYGFFRSIRFLIGLGCIAIIALLLYVCLIFGLCHEIFREISLHHQYGVDWTVQYEQTYGPLSRAHQNMGIALFGITGLTIAWILLVRGLKNAGRGTPRKRKRDESRIERHVRYKRNALLGVYFGVPGILLSVLLTIFRWGIFAEHSNEVVLAIFVFLGAYCAVMSGCYWWAKAKGWNEAVVSIGFGPLFIFFIPFVRVLVFKVPGLLVAAMVMAPFILVVVMAVLPDKSGHSRRRAEWEKRR